MIILSYIEKKNNLLVQQHVLTHWICNSYVQTDVNFSFSL